MSLTHSVTNEIAEVAIAYVEARARRNQSKARRNTHECEVQDEAEHDEVGVVHRGWAPCYVRGDGDRCDTCIRRDGAHEDYLREARAMGAWWRKLKRTVEGRDK